MSVSATVNSLTAPDDLPIIRSGMRCMSCMIAVSLFVYCSDVTGGIGPETGEGFATGICGGTSGSGEIGPIVIWPPLT